MKFRDFLLGEERYKGLRRMFDKAQPHTPAYVRQQMYNQTIAPKMKNALADNELALKSQQGNGNAGVDTATGRKISTLAANKSEYDPESTITAIPPEGQQPQTDAFPYKDPKTLPSSIIGNPELNHLHNVRFNPKPQRVTISPAHLEDNTLSRLRMVRFGMKPSKQVSNDEARFGLQSQLADERGEGSNEPIVLIRQNDGKYKIADGYHRAASYLIKGAPRVDIEEVKKGDFSYVNFANWRPVALMAYIGFPRNMNPVEMPSSPPPHAVMPAAFQPDGQPAATIASVSPNS